MGRFGQWLGLTHTQRHHAHYHTAGDGHLYQGRFKSFPVQDDHHFPAVCRYVERNAYTAGLCDWPDQWRFGSLWRWAHAAKAEQALLAAWPIPRRPNWIDFVAPPLTDKEPKAMQRSISRGVPFGDEAWVTKTIRRLGLESTLRPRGETKDTAQIPITVPDTYLTPCLLHRALGQRTTSLGRTGFRRVSATSASRAARVHA